MWERKGIAFPAGAIMLNNRSHHSVLSQGILAQQNETASQAAPHTSRPAKLLCSFEDTRVCFRFAPALLLLSPTVALGYAPTSCRGGGEPKEPPALHHRSKPCCAGHSVPLAEERANTERRDKGTKPSLFAPYPRQRREAENISYFMPLACGSKNIVL